VQLLPNALEAGDKNKRRDIFIGASV